MPPHSQSVSAHKAWEVGRVGGALVEVSQLQDPNQMWPANWQPAISVETQVESQKMPLGDADAEWECDIGGGGFPEALTFSCCLQLPKLQLRGGERGDWVCQDTISSHYFLSLTVITLWYIPFLSSSTSLILGIISMVTGMHLWPWGYSSLPVYLS